VVCGEKVVFQNDNLSYLKTLFKWDKNNFE